MKNIYIIILVLCVSFSLKAQSFMSSFPITFSNGGVATIDINQDSFPDIVFLKREPFSQQSNRLIRLTNNGEAALSFTEMELATVNEIFGTPTAADFDQDGDVDIIFSGEDEGALILFNGEVNGGLNETSLSIAGAGRFALADLNGDDFPDMVGLSFIDEEIVAYLNMSGEGFSRSVIYGTGIEPSAYHVVDIDGDGDDDVITGTDDFTEESLIILINDGAGAFSSQVLESTSSIVRSVNGISSGDLNGDGKVDFVIVTSSKCFSYTQGDDLSFERIERFASADILRSVVVGDFNGDERSDFVLGDNSSVGISLYLNDGIDIPSFEVSEVSSIQPVFSLSAADMNRDGDLDLVASNGSVYAYENQIEQVPPVSISSVVVREASLYPNPVGEGTVLLTGDALDVIGTYQILDMTGRLVGQGELDRSGRIDVRGMVGGSYLLRLFEGEVFWGRGKIFIL